MSKKAKVQLNLPHKAPILFVKKVLQRDEKSAKVLVAFEEIPSLAMLIEAAAQGSAALGDGSAKMGFLVSLKNIKQTQEVSSKEFEIDVVNENDLGTMRAVSFEVFEKKVSVANGSLVIKLEEIG